MLKYHLHQQWKVLKPSLAPRGISGQVNSSFQTKGTIIIAESKLISTKKKKVEKDFQTKVIIMEDLKTAKKLINMRITLLKKRKFITIIKDISNIVAKINKSSTGSRHQLHRL